MFYKTGEEYIDSCLLVNKATILDLRETLNFWNWLVITGSFYLKRSRALTPASDQLVLP